MLIVAHGQTHEMNHAPRKIADADGLTHVEHEDIAAVGHGAGLNHELRRLRNGHEVADHLGMGHGHRAARFDLLVEQGHHRPRGGQYVAESHHAKARLAAATMQPLQHDFGEALGRAHDVGRIHRLVGRDQHEGFDLGLVRRLRGIPGGDDIVVNALDDVLFHNRYMFVGRRVVNGLHPVGVKDLAHAKLVMRIADEPDQLDPQGMSAPPIVRSSRSML